MTSNPYDPPRAEYLPQSLAPRDPGEPMPWSIDDVLVVAWNAFRQHWPVLVFAPIVAQLVSAIPPWVPSVAVLAHAVALVARSTRCSRPSAAPSDS